jgi:PKD repeat protein
VYAESVVYDPAAHETLLFGGCYVKQCPGNETWAFTNGSWTNLTPRSGSPPARDYASLDYDPHMGGVLLFGGQGTNHGPLDDTWLYRGGVWTNLTYVSPAPPARWGAALAFDPDPEANGSVLYGGCGGGLSCGFNDTWVWQGGAGWTDLTLAGPGPAVSSEAMAFDPVDDYLLLFGGCGGVFCLGLSNQTWEFYGGQWWEGTPATHPVARAGTELVYDPVGHRMVLFGGQNFTIYFSDTWSYSGGVWQPLAPASSPSARSDAGLALDASGTALLLVGGNVAGTSENDTWLFTVPDSVLLTSSALALETTQSVDVNASVTGGVAPYHLTVAFGDGTGAAVSGPGPTFSLAHRYGFAGAYVASVNLTDADGLVASASTASIRVTSGPALNATATPLWTDVGLAVSFLATNISGAAPFAYAWSFGDGASATGASPSHAFSAPGTYTVRANLTDAFGVTANDSLTVTVVALPSAAPLSFSPAAPNNTTPVEWHSSVSGGTAPLSYSWRFGDGTGSSIPSPTHTFGTPGTYRVTLWVNDTVGGRSFETASITVSAAKLSSPPPPPPSNNSTTVVRTTNVTAPAPSWFWPAVVGLVAAGGAGSFALLRWGRPRVAR